MMTPEALLAELVAIDSSNPGLVPGAAGESAIADFVSGWLSSRGFTCHRLEDTPGRPSIVAIANGTGGGQSIMLNGHLDTVSLASYESGQGLTPQVRDGKLYGRGAYDMKSGIAALMIAGARAAARPHRGDILLALVADEEYASAGTEEVLRSYMADAAIVVEPTELDVKIAHRGFVWAEVTVHGTAAHGSRPDLGIDAITKAGKFLVGLEELQHRLATGPRHPLLDTGSVHASLIAGGDELSTYPGTCVVSLERRTLPDEDATTTEGELRTILDDIALSDPDFRAEVKILLERPAFAVDPEAHVVTTLSEAFRAVTGRPAVHRGEQFWTDCALYQAAGIPCTLFGVAGGGAHAATEWVTLDSLNTLTDTLTKTLITFTE
jgi:acetylornithine deacetylase